MPAALTDPGLAMRAGPVAVPLELRMPSLSVDVPVIGVGMSTEDVMDAPMGPADDPVWQQAFWYRGSAIPGEPSTALLAGHVDDPLGRPAVFAHIEDLRPGDPIVVHDTRSGLDVRFSVTETKTYTLEETTDPAVLTEIYGAGPVAGTWPQPSTDGLAHLTLITCAGHVPGHHPRPPPRGLRHPGGLSRPSVEEAGGGVDDQAAGGGAADHEHQRHQLPAREDEQVGGGIGLHRLHRPVGCPVDADHLGPDELVDPQGVVVGAAGQGLGHEDGAPEGLGPVAVTDALEGDDPPALVGRGRTGG